MNIKHFSLSYASWASATCLARKVALDKHGCKQLQSEFDSNEKIPADQTAPGEKQFCNYQI